MGELNGVRSSCESKDIPRDGLPFEIVQMGENFNSGVILKERMITAFNPF